MITKSEAYTYHNRGFSTELVKKREEQAYSFLVPKTKRNNTQYIQDKLNDILVADATLVLLPAKSKIIIITLTDPGGIVSAINEVFAQLNVTYEAELGGWTEEGKIDYQSRTLPERIRRPLTDQEIVCFRVLFEGKSLRTIEDLLNIVWLPDHLKAKIIPTKKTVLIVNVADLASLVREANELLRGVGSGFYIKLKNREVEKDIYPLLRVV